MTGKSNIHKKMYEKDHWSGLYGKHARLNVRRDDRKRATKRERIELNKETKEDGK